MNGMPRMPQLPEMGEMPQMPTLPSLPQLPQLPLDQLLPGSQGESAQLDLPSVDWSFIDAAFLITCPQADGTNPRLDRAWRQLQAVGLDARTEVREFGTDDEDR